MFSQTLLTELYRHMEWADASVWSAVRRWDGAMDERLCQLLTHIHVVQRAFLHVWTTRPLEQALRRPADFARLDDLGTWAASYYAEAFQFIGGLSTEQLAAPVELPWAAGLSQHLGRPPGVTTLGETCFQVTSHSTYHRGQVNVRLRELGVEPPPVDYIAWCWFGRPAPVWSGAVAPE